MKFLSRRREMPLRYHATLVAPGDTRRLVSVSIGPDNEAIMLWTAAAGAFAAGDRPDVANGAAPYSMRTRPVRAIVTTQSPQPGHQVVIAEMWASFPLVQPMPDGKVLIVGSNALWTEDGPERNATIHGPQGDVELSACVGDGISHAIATATGALWLGFTDTGIYGNMGWGQPGASAPMGIPGIVRLNSQLEQDWEFPSKGVRMIDHCYAMNWDGDRLWAYYYSDFPVVAVEEERVRSWETNVDGAEGLVTDGMTAVLVGGYGGDYDRLVVGRLDGQFLEAETMQLTMPDGAPLPHEAKIFARGGELHVFANTDWFRIDLDSITS